MKRQPVCTLIAIFCCLFIPMATNALVEGGKDNMQRAFSTLLSIPISAALGLLFAANGAYRREQPRWLNWAAIALCGTLIYLFGVPLL